MKYKGIPNRNPKRMLEEIVDTKIQKIIKNNRCFIMELVFRI